MTIREAEESLFAQWRKDREGFVADGVVDEESYLSSNPKLLVVMKEVNDPGGGDWDLRQFIAEGARSQTWDNITRWVHGIRRLPSELPWAQLSEITEESRRSTLRSISAINVKKSPGGHTTDNKALWGISGADKKYFNRQFALYNPDITICCGSVTSNILHRLVDFTPPPKWLMTTRGVLYHERAPEKFVISYAHPEARVADCLLFYGIVDALREISSVG
ncbi:MAG: hypothetical protein NT106_10645 [Candidatus Sumerlaeota bacterium]|nr:hypothetical protein [Candidatus Sumerlaeota bacterium]